MTETSTAAGSVVLRQARIATGAGFAAQGFALAVLLTSTPDFTRLYRLSTGGLTAIVASLPFLAAAGNLLAARAAGRVGSAVTLRAGLVLLSVSVAGIAASSGRVMFITTFAVYAIGVGAVDLGTNMQAVELERRYGRSILVSFFAAWSIAGVAGALLTSGTAQLDWPVPVRLALPCLVGITAAVMGRRLLHVGVQEERLIAEQHPVGHALLEVEPGVAPSGKPGGEPRTAGRLPWRALFPLGAAVLVVFLIDSAMSSWTTQYLHVVLLASTAAAPLGYAAYQATSVAARLGADLAVRRWGPAWVVRAGGVIGSAGLLALASAPTLVVAILGAGLVGVGLAAVAPLSFAAAGRLDPSRTEALVAQLNLFNYVGVVAGGAVVGALGTVGQFRLAFAVPALLTASLLVLGAAFGVAGRSPS